MCSSEGRESPSLNWNKSKVGTARLDGKSSRTGEDATPNAGMDGGNPSGLVIANAVKQSPIQLKELRIEN
ncbi:MAG: hypothetical protein LBT83_05175 [Tannerella sp.]|nr:hypothetical protein [Tannerella sp.]